MTVRPYVPMTWATTTFPDATARTEVPVLAPIPMPFHRVVVLFGFTTRPNRYRMRPSTGQSSRPRSRVDSVLADDAAADELLAAFRRAFSIEEITEPSRASDFAISANRSSVSDA